MPTGRDIPLLLIGIIGIGTSGPVIALSTMPILALIFWRNLGGALSMLPFAIRHEFRLAKVNQSQLRILHIAKLFFGLHLLALHWHFILWVSLLPCVTQRWLPELH